MSALFCWLFYAVKAYKPTCIAVSGEHKDIGWGHYALYYIFFLYQLSPTYLWLRSLWMPSNT